VSHKRRLKEKKSGEREKFSNSRPALILLFAPLFARHLCTLELPLRIPNEYEVVTLPQIMNHPVIIMRPTAVTLHLRTPLPQDPIHLSPRHPTVRRGTLRSTARTSSRVSSPCARTDLKTPAKQTRASMKISTFILLKPPLFAGSRTSCYRVSSTLFPVVISTSSNDNPSPSIKDQTSEQKKWSIVRICCFNKPSCCMTGRISQ
jgi:hypothetical protein